MISTYKSTSVSENQKNVQKSQYNCSVGSLSKYNGEWDFNAAAHLLRRTTFGATGAEIKAAASESLETVIAKLFSTSSMPDDPINYGFEDDPNVAIGESWVGKPVERGDTASMIINYRRSSLRIWQLDNLLTSELNIREQMTLFWHGHFVTEMETVRDASFTHKYITTLREHATGNFKTLTELMTIDAAMLRYLNGNQNSNRAPNENFARELLELFTIGKGALAGEGDYTTFTEEDVVEAAKVLTGWVDSGYFARDGREIGARFVNNRHETATKVMSHRFNNTEITDQGEEEYKTLINLIFEQKEVARFICRKLYRWFVYYDITSEVEENIIEPLATQLQNSDFEIEPILKTLLSSDHFFSICSVGPMIKNPISFLVGLMRQMNIALPENDLIRRYAVLLRLSRSIDTAEMTYFDPPNVAGWKAYYQEPLYYRIWISSVTLRNRQNISDVLASGQARAAGFTVTVDLLDYISSFDDPYDPNNLIKEFVANLFPQPISDEQLDFLKEILIPGLPDFEWTVEYDLYLNDPNNEETRLSVDQKLRNFFAALLKMPEYYLS